MPRFWLLGFIAFCVSTCAHQPPSLSGDAPIDAKDFINAFAPLNLPFYAADTNIAKIGDTLTISTAVFDGFFPDTVLQKFINPSQLENLAIHPVGRIDKENEKYYLATITQKRRVNMVAFLTDKKGRYLASIQLLSNRNGDGYLHSVQINREPTFTISRDKKVTEADIKYTHTGYAYSSDPGTFVKIVDDSNEGTQKTNEVINPIDTFARKNKYSGDYAEDKRNYISIRDGKNATSYVFFIHFEKDDGDCIGELKGDFAMRNATEGVYKETAGPCGISFMFEDNEITLKENGNCGNHRGIKCYFDDTFRKKRETKAKKAPK